MKIIFDKMRSFIMKISCIGVFFLPLNAIAETDTSRNAELLHSKALVLTAKGKHQDALVVFEEAVNADLPSAPLLYDYANLASMLKHYHLSLQLYQAIYTMNPSYASVSTDLAMAYMNTGNYKDAERVLDSFKPQRVLSIREKEDLEQLLSSSPLDKQKALGRLYLGITQLYQKKYTPAQQSLLYAAEGKSPYQAQALVLLAKIENETHQGKLSPIYTAKAKEIDPSLGIEEKNDNQKSFFQHSLGINGGFQYDSNITLVPQALFNDPLIQNNLDTAGYRFVFDSELNGKYKLFQKVSAHWQVQGMMGFHLNNRDEMKENDYASPSINTGFSIDHKPFEAATSALYRSVFTQEIQDLFSEEWGIEFSIGTKKKKYQTRMFYQFIDRSFFDQALPISPDDNRDTKAHLFALVPTFQMKKISPSLFLGYEGGAANGQNYNYRSAQLGPSVSLSYLSPLTVIAHSFFNFKDFYSYDSAIAETRKDLTAAIGLQLLWQTSPIYAIQCGYQYIQNISLGIDNQDDSPFAYTKQMLSLNVHYYL